MDFDELVGATAAGNMASSGVEVVAVDEATGWEHRCGKVCNGLPVEQTV